MSASFVLTLDTQGPAGLSIVLNSGATYTGAQAITAAISTSDGSTTGYTMKLWGDVDAAADPNVQPLEANSAWIAYSASKALTLATVDGLKTINLKVRDAEWNESSASDTITLDASLPVVTISGPDVARVSKISGKRTASFSFSPDTDIVAYKVKVVPATNSLENAGTQIGTTNGSTNMSGGAVSSGGTVNCQIDGRDLEAASAGDGDKIIKVFGQEASGNWSV